MIYFITCPLGSPRFFLFLKSAKFSLFSRHLIKQVITSLCTYYREPEGAMKEMYFPFPPQWLGLDSSNELNFYPVSNYLKWIKVGLETCFPL